MRRAFCESDDLWCEQQIIDLLLPLREAVGSKFQFTCFAIPNKLGSVQTLRERYPWIVFAIHGFEHDFGECRSWHSNLASARLEAALEMGYDPVFKPPNWICDIETELACKELGIILHHHKTYEPTVPGLRAYPGPRKRRALLPEHDLLHSHLQRNPVTDFIEDSSDFRLRKLKSYHLFLSPESLVVEV